MSSFKIVRSPIKYKIWKWINKISGDRVKQYQDLTIDVVNVILPTPSTMIIKFTAVNTGKKYELVNQGKFSELYRLQSEEGSVDKQLINTETIIRELFNTSYEIN